MKEKAKLVLLSKKNAEDVAALARLFEKLTGRKPTQAELEDARRQLGK